MISKKQLNSLKIFKEIGDKAGESACYTNLGMAYNGLGNFRKAIELHENSMKILKKLGIKQSSQKVMQI